jgi:uncharacterized protein YbjT (DUF2867 family)
VPVIVVGGDTAVGRSIIDALVEPEREVRAFVTDITAAEELRALGVKVALGDVSDPSHIEGACTRCFSAVLVTEAAFDDRERSFARTPEAVLRGWIDAVRAANVTRVIWVGDGALSVDGIEWATVALTEPNVAARVAELDDARSL